MKRRSFLAMLGLAPVAGVAAAKAAPVAANYTDAIVPLTGCDSALAQRIDLLTSSVEPFRFEDGVLCLRQANIGTLQVSRFVDENGAPLVEMSGNKLIIHG